MKKKDTRFSLIKKLTELLEKEDTRMLAFDVYLGQDPYFSTDVYVIRARLNKDRSVSVLLEDSDLTRNWTGIQDIETSTIKEIVNSI